MENEYKVGSLLWIERNRYIELRRTLEAVIAGELTKEGAKQILNVGDTDLASW